MTGKGKDPDDLRVGAVGGTQRSEGAEGAGAVAEAEGSRGAAALDGVGNSGQVGGADAIAASLGSGAIDATEARAQLIDEAVRAQLPPDADPATIESVRSEVEALLATDPTLDDLLRT